jgi:recombination protein RecA
MTSAYALRLQIESTLAHRIPSALTPAQKTLRPVAATGIGPLDDVLRGGLPIGAISELLGSECSGRTSIAFSFLAHLTLAEKVCAWIDVSNAFDPLSAAAAGIDLARLLWVRCGVSQANVVRRHCDFVLPERYYVPSPVKKGLHGGGFGSHPRNEVKGLSDAVAGLLKQEAIAPRCAEPQRRTRPSQQTFEPRYKTASTKASYASHSKPWSRIEQALRATDLLLQGGGFSAIVLDMGGLAPEFVSRVPLATWFRYRAAAERTQSSILLLTQYGCAKSSAELLLRLEPAEALCDETTVFTGIKPRVVVARQRFTESADSNLVPLRKSPQSTHAASWQSRTTWAGSR